MKKLIILLTTTFVFFSCEKDLDISDFSDDYSFYEPEIRIEGIIYPTENSALVRIDKSVRIDEADLYDCIDDDSDWNYYFSAQVDSSFESLQECQGFLGEGGDCTLHLYACVDYESEDENEFLWTFTDRESCLTGCPWYCITDDTGSDGILTPPEGEGMGFIQPDEDGSENNGQPDCNEKNVDEYNEILPNIHVDECEVKIKNGGKECNLSFNESAGEFFEFSGKRSGGDFEAVNYGGFIPDSSCIDGFFQNYDTEYELNVNCTNIETFSRYGTIKAKDIIKKPPVAFHPNKYDEMIDCTVSPNTYDCFQNNGFSNNDTLIFITQKIPTDFNEEIGDTITQDLVLSFFHNLGLHDSNFYFDSSFVFVGQGEAEINYSALSETMKFQSIQYFKDEYTGNYIYLHGHPDGVTDSGEMFYDDKMCIMTEFVVAEQMEDVVQFKYVFNTFSEGFENYYFFDLLDIADPVRTNIRDENGNPIMGGFGSMASETVHFYILTPTDLIDLYLELN